MYTQAGWLWNFILKRYEDTLFSKVENINKKTGNTQVDRLKDGIIMVRMSIFLLCVMYWENAPKVD